MLWQCGLYVFIFPNALVIREAEMRNSMLSQILEQGARARCKLIVVKYVNMIFGATMLGPRRVELVLF